ncbi:MAG: hypothetical protein SFZ23_04535 [Planctomycetota bacterium]|nr:hypothetical protein [Planctomycetota bacterium]
MVAPLVRPLVVLLLALAGCHSPSILVDNQSDRTINGFVQGYREVPSIKGTSRFAERRAFSLHPNKSEVFIPSGDAWVSVKWGSPCLLAIEDRAGVWHVWKVDLKDDYSTRIRFTIDEVDGEWSATSNRPVKKHVFDDWRTATEKVAGKSDHPTVEAYWRHRLLERLDEASDRDGPTKDES